MGAWLVYNNCPGHKDYQHLNWDTEILLLSPLCKLSMAQWWTTSISPPVVNWVQGLKREYADSTLQEVPRFSSETLTLHRWNVTELTSWRPLRPRGRATLLASLKTQSSALPSILILIPISQGISQYAHGGWLIPGPLIPFQYVTTVSRCEVRTVKSSPPLNLGINKFTCLPKHSFIGEILGEFRWLTYR